MFIVAFWFIIVLIVALGTFWGWKNIVFPYFWPAINFGFKASMVLWWTGFVFFILSLAPVTWRMWGSTPFNAWFARQMEYEANVDPEGAWTPAWREKCAENHYPKLGNQMSECETWFGKRMWCRDMEWCAACREGKDVGRQMFPTWTIVFLPGVVVGFVAYRRRVNRRRLTRLAPPGPTAEENRNFFEMLRRVNRVGVSRDPDVRPQRPKSD